MRGHRSLVHRLHSCRRHGVTLHTILHGINRRSLCRLEDATPRSSCLLMVSKRFDHFRECAPPLPFPDTIENQHMMSTGVDNFSRLGNGASPLELISAQRRPVGASRPRCVLFAPLDIIYPLWAGVTCTHPLTSVPMILTDKLSIHMELAYESSCRGKGKAELCGMVQYATINALTASLYDDISLLLDASYYTQCV